jgi:hypothetical protein
VAAAVVALSAVGFQRSSAGSTTPTSYTAYVGPGNPSRLSALATSWKYTPTVANDYFDDSSWAGISDDTWAVDQWKPTGDRMIWGVPMLPSISGVSLADGANGDYDAYFVQMARNLVANGMANSILRIGFEFNQTSFPWYAGGQAATFVAYWQRIVNDVRSVPGANFQIEWNPSRADYSSSFGDLSTYYPGDQYVDIIGLDVYDIAWETYPGPAAEYQYILTQQWGLDWFASFAAAHAKPMDLPEVGLGWTGGGVVGGGDDPTFVTDMLDWSVANHVAHFVYWDSGTSSIDNGQNPQSAAALAAFLSALSTSSTTSTTTTAPPPTTTTATAPPPTTTTTIGSGSGSGSTVTGYYEVAAKGAVYAFGAPYQGSMSGSALNAPVVAISRDPSASGYYEVGADGAIFAFNAPFLGSMGGTALNAPVVGMAVDPATGGYYEVAADGGIFAFNAPFQGSMGGTALNAPIVGMAVDPATGGYFEVAADGGIFTFNAPFQGSMGGGHLKLPIVGMSVNIASGGYFEVGSDGSIYAFHASSLGSEAHAHLSSPIVGMA